MSADLAALKRRLCDGLQVLTGEGVLTGLGHLSCRVPDSDTFLINPRLAGVLADPEDMADCLADHWGPFLRGHGVVVGGRASRVPASRPSSLNAPARINCC